MKILITGAGGQIGHDLIGALVAQGHEVVSTDLAPRPPSHAHAGGKWQRLDVTDAKAAEELIAELRPELVFHLAAILSARGEKGVLTVGTDVLMRLTSNPFFQVLAERTAAFVAR